MTRRFEPNFLLELFSNPLDPGYADAAAQREQYGPRSPWRRRGAYALRLVALVTIGFLLAMAYREATASAPANTTAHQGLVEQAKLAQARSDDLQRQSEQLRRQVTAQQQAALGSSAEQLAQVREQEAAAGLAPVTGGGVVVRLADAPAQLDPTTGKPSNAQVSRVLDVDLQSVVNGLWASGAEAIAINGQRLASTSTIRTAGNAVLVDFRPVTSPYDVSAIGPDDLEERFGRTAAAAGLRDLVNTYGLGFGTRTVSDLQLPAAPDLVLRYAHPVPSPSGSVR